MKKLEKVLPENIEDFLVQYDKAIEQLEEAGETLIWKSSRVTYNLHFNSRYVLITRVTKGTNAGTARFIYHREAQRIVGEGRITKNTLEILSTKVREMEKENE
jgi:hypothetical protein